MIQRSRLKIPIISLSSLLISVGNLADIHYFFLGYFSFLAYLLVLYNPESINV